MITGPQLLTVPNFSQGSDLGLVERLAVAAAPLRLLATHSDEDHGRCVLTLAGRQGEIVPALVNCASLAIKEIDVSGHDGVHPHIGALDVAPVVYLHLADRGAACAEALVLAESLATERELPIFLYGDLADGRERAELRRGGTQQLALRIASGELSPDFGPAQLHPTAGATLVGARPPLVAFNFDLQPNHTLAEAQAIAANVREAGGGPHGVRAIGLWLESRAIAQVSCNVHDPFAVPLAEIADLIATQATVTNAELIGLAPGDAFVDWPQDLPISGFDAQSSIIEHVLGMPNPDGS